MSTTSSESSSSLESALLQENLLSGECLETTGCIAVHTPLPSDLSYLFEVIAPAIFGTEATHFQIKPDEHLVLFWAEPQPPSEKPS